MTTEYDAKAMLSQPEVRSYFLSILDSPLSREEKYQRFVDFFDMAARLCRGLERAEVPVVSADAKLTPEQCVGIVTAAARKAELWKPEEALDTTQESIRRALSWMQTHHQRYGEGGCWGYAGQARSIWGTCHALLALLEAHDGLQPDYDPQSYIDSALRWLESEQSEWVPRPEASSRAWRIYDLSLVVRALAEARRGIHNGLSQAAATTVAYLLTAQHDDGGWPTGEPGSEWSDTGATSMAVQAIVAWGHRVEPADISPFRGVVEAALDWFLKQRNRDGIWKRQFRDERGDFQECPSFTKTCDAIRALFLGSQFLRNSPPPEMDDAIRWVLNQEQLLLNPGGQIEGWGFREGLEDGVTDDLNCTCLALETLVPHATVALPALWANARWLIAAQQPATAGSEAGGWEHGDTYRITRGLIRFYRRVEAELRLPTAEVGVAAQTPSNVPEPQGSLFDEPGKSIHAR
jgi:hypothetical protein